MAATSLLPALGHLMTEDAFYVGIRIASGGVSKPLESAFLNCSFDVQQLAYIVKTFGRDIVMRASFEDITMA